MNNLNLSYIKRTIIFFACSFVIYGYGLFPGRIYGDSVTLLGLMAKGKSVDTWGASYFRLLQAVTFNGQYVFLMSLFIATIFYLSFFYFLWNLKYSWKVKCAAGSIFVFTPFVGVFAFTIGHDGLIASASLIYVTILIEVDKREIRRYEFFMALLAALLSSTSGLGVVVTFGFCISLIIRKKMTLSLVCLSLSFLLFFAGSAIFNVERSKFDMSIMSFLGDVKCIAQHPEAEISESQWKQLKQFGDIKDWQEEHSCVVADYSFFAFENASKGRKQFITLWAELAAQNPQIALQARIQRTSVALPPLFFRNPPNMFDTNYMNPVGVGAMSDLQIFPDLFKTSVDLPVEQKHQLFQQRILESLVLLPTFVFNQRSDVWGWGGLWLSLAFYLLYKYLGRRFDKLMLVMLPMLSLHVGIVLLAPAPSPRYAFPSVILGVFMVVLHICNYFIKENQSPKK